MVRGPCFQILLDLQTTWRSTAKVEKLLRALDAELVITDLDSSIMASMLTGALQISLLGFDA